MIWLDSLTVGRWWLMWFGFGLIGWPVVQRFFSNWKDKGYVLAKIVGAGGISFLTLILAMTPIFDFSLATISLGALIMIFIGGGMFKKKLDFKSINWKLVLVEELLFVTCLFGWAFVKGHESTINGLEKFMDYGFTKSILQSQHMPPADMWFAGENINYYYFGHFILATATKLSGIPLATTFNIHLATLFALCFSMSFGIGNRLLENKGGKKAILGGLLIAYLVSFGGNLQTIYAYTTGYSGHEDNPPPFWEIFINPFDKDSRTGAWEGYWYPNATRFIPYTIHEFPSYSFVVSDLHGHVLDIPLALLAIGFIFEKFFRGQGRMKLIEAGFFGWLSGIMFMTNALDGPIYLGLFAGLSFWEVILKKIPINRWLLIMSVAGAIFWLSALPFTAHFKSFVSGVAVNCPSENLANSKIGPLLFEGVEKCQHSPAWMLLILWGFFLYCGVWLIAKEWRNREQSSSKFWQWTWLIVYCAILILFAEVFYFKDIYPQHFRSNTMFKLGYQAFMMLAIASGYSIINLIDVKRKWLIKGLFIIGLSPLLYLVSIYPLFSVRSYFGLPTWTNYKQLSGLNWISERYPDYQAAIDWLGQETANSQPVILEANGDSYTDYNLVSTFTGLPTVAGWTVHEWLWRDGYEPIAKRAEEVRQVYEANNKEEAMSVLKKYRVKYIVVGQLERTKYTQLNEEVIATLGWPVFQSQTVTVYQVQ